MFFFRLPKFERTNISDFQGPKNVFNLDYPGPPIPVVDSLLIPIYTHIHKYTQILKLVEGYLTGNPKVYIDIYDYIRIISYNIVRDHIFVGKHLSVFWKVSLKSIHELPMDYPIDFFTEINLSIGLLVVTVTHHYPTKKKSQMYPHYCDPRIIGFLPSQVVQDFFHSHYIPAIPQVMRLLGCTQNVQVQVPRPGLEVDGRPFRSLGMFQWGFLRDYPRNISLVLICFNWF